MDHAHSTLAIIIYIYFLLPFIKHFSVSQGLCFDIHDLTFRDYEDSVPFIEVIVEGSQCQLFGVWSKYNL